MTNKIIVVVLCVISYAAGWGFRMLTHVCPTAEPEMKTEVKYEADTKTEVVYVPNIFMSMVVQKKQMSMFK
mgnify:CR=1 FL=1